MASARHQPSKLLDLELTIVSAKHLKNVNWRNGDLKPYAVFWVDPDRRLATKSDESGSTRPVWNERFTLLLSLPLQESYLTLEVFHSNPSETPKPLVGTLRVALKDLPDQDDPTRIRAFYMTRPSGRPQGKIRIKIAVRERPLPPPPPQIDYHHVTPPHSYYYSAPVSISPRDYRYGPTIPPPPSASPPPYSSYHESYPPSSPYYPGYYSSGPGPALGPPMPPRPIFDRVSSYSGGGPSAPVDYSGYDQRQKGGKMGFGTGLAVGAVAGALGGLALDEGLKYEEQKIAERVEKDLAPSRDDYNDYRVDY